MKYLKTTSRSLAVIVAVAGGVGSLASDNAHATDLTEAGKQIKDRYTTKLEAAKSSILDQLPSIDAERKATYEQAREAEMATHEQLANAQKRISEYNSARGLVGHARGHWIGTAERNIAAAEKKLKDATTDAERKQAREELAKWQENRADGVQALEERTAAYEKIKKEKTQIDQAVADARQAVEDAKNATLQAVADMGVASLLSSDALDATLAKFVVLKEATPKGLAEFARQGAKHQQLVDSLLGDTSLMIQMLVADGAKDGNYGRAMEIYQGIQDASDHAGEGALQRLAVGIAVEHATPRKLRNIKSETDAPEFVDPVQRYLHFETAFLNDELDPNFATHSAWNYRFVVDGEEPDKILTWGRDMLRNYRPDHVTAQDQRWRYVGLVRSDIPYGSQNVKHDQDHLHFFQNILMNGGICGRRAFIGRFVLRAFGVPTTARPSRGHGALVRWTPDGWVAVLGGGWGAGWTHTPYGDDLNFVATTQARAAGDDAFMRVKRAQWIGDVMGERRAYGFVGQNPGFWGGISLYTQRAVIEAADALALDAIGEDIAEASDTKEEVEVARVTITEADRSISVDSAGVITIPAAATTKPTSSTRHILFHNSVLGGHQLHFSRGGGGSSFEYTFNAPAAGKYQLTARVVTPTWKQSMEVTANGSEAVAIDLPFTVGMWDQTQPVVVELKQGENHLSFTREGNVMGITVRDFTLTPISGAVSQR